MFQAGRSFDLPDPERFRRVNATGWGLDNNTPSKLGCVIFDSDGLSSTLKRTAIRHAQDEMSTDSCGENIRYQAVEGLVHLDNRPKRQMSFLKQVSVWLGMLFKLEILLYQYIFFPIIFLLLFTIINISICSKAITLAWKIY